MSVVALFLNIFGCFADAEGHNSGANYDTTNFPSIEPTNQPTN